MSGFDVGDRLAGYELLELVGEGRMGQVYRAVQPRLERVVAVRIIRPELAADEHFRERFRHEMKVAASIDHPNIIPVYEVDEQDGALFAAMRWVDGADLSRLIADQGRLAPPQAVRILGRVAAALEAAHGVGLFHRDLKPTNILLEGDRVYLADFGLAAAGDSVDGERLSSLIGSVEYAAPELLDDAPPDSRTDVYGLGCVLYEMLTGSVPFPPESLAISPRAHHPVPASELRDGLPPAIDAVLQRALSSDPADRYPTPARFVEAVEGALAGSVRADEPRPRRRRRRRRLLAIGAVAILAVAAGVAIVLAIGHGDGSGKAKASASAAHVGGRDLPAAATLPDCGKTFSGPPRDCRSSAGGINVLSDLDKPLHLATMNFIVTGVHEGTQLRDQDGAGFTAPSGTRFVVIDATITNLTKKQREFEPDNFTVPGRNAALWIFDQQGKVVPYHGPGGADYSTQYDTVAGTLAAPLVDVKLSPGIPYSGQLVFYYPDTTLDTYHRALLEVNELGRGFGYSGSVGGVRLHL